VEDWALCANIRQPFWAENRNFLSLSRNTGYQNLTQDALSKKADLPYTTLAKIESDVIQNPTLETITKIADGLDISLVELVN
jgi:DNA-binding XRE family transcriptional regulator